MNCSVQKSLINNESHWTRKNVWKLIDRKKEVLTFFLLPSTSSASSIPCVRMNVMNSHFKISLSWALFDTQKPWLVVLWSSQLFNEFFCSDSDWSWFLEQNDSVLFSDGLTRGECQGTESLNSWNDSLN